MLKRLLLTLAAATVVLGSPLAADLAFAKDGGRGGRWEQSDRGRGRGHDEGRWRGGGRHDDGRRWEQRGPRDRGGYERRYYEDAPRYAPPRAQRVRPGGYLPPEYRGAPVMDYPRYRLRPPPSGYAWRRMGDAFVLVDRDGQVFDIIPY